MRFLLLFLFLYLSVFAQEESKKAGLEKMIQAKVSLQSTYLSEAKLDGYEGSAKVDKNRVSINNKIIGFSYTNWGFDWNNLNDLPFGNGVDKPIEQMHSFRLNANIPYFVDENLFILTSLSVKSTFEAESSDSYGAGFFSFASYKVDEEHAIQFGFFANYHPISTLAMPVISYSYRAKESDGFKFIFGYPRTYVGYHIDRKTLLRYGVVFSQSVIRLSDLSAIESSGFIEAKDYMSNVGISYELNPSFSIESDLLYSLKRDFIIYSKDGDELDTHSIEPSFGVNFKITYLF